MTRQQIILRKPSSNRRQPLLSKNEHSSGNSRFAEVAGGATAECAAVCCCCPCGIMNLLVLAVYKLPAGLCKKALKKKRRKQLMNAGLLTQRRKCSCGCDNPEYQIHPVPIDMFDIDNSDKLSEQEVMELEKEMWEKFYGTGFWRSPSQKENE